MKLKAYFSVIKPGIIMGNAITASAGFALASRGHVDWGLFLAMLAGLSLIIGSGCVFNNYIDREADQKMARTQRRALAKGEISSKGALGFAAVLLLLGSFVLIFNVNFLAAAIALLGFVVYVFFYSFLKYRTAHATLIGSIAGAIPPVVGYCAVSNRLDLAALLLFGIIALWQMPHFFAIAIYRIEEYAAASIPVLPIAKGVASTKLQMFLYVIGFCLSALLLTVFGYTGIAYALTVCALGVAWLVLAIQGFKTQDPKPWARKMFVFSLIAVTTLCAVIPFSILS